MRPHFLARAVAGGTLGSFAVMRRGLDISFLLALADSLQVATCDDSQDNASIPLPIRSSLSFLRPIAARQLEPALPFLPPPWRWRTRIHGGK